MRGDELVSPVYVNAYSVINRGCQLRPGTTRHRQPVVPTGLVSGRSLACLGVSQPRTLRGISLNSSERVKAVDRVGVYSLCMRASLLGWLIHAAIGGLACWGSR